MILACTTVTSALPDMGVHRGSARELWASNDPTPSPQPRSGPLVWMGDPDEFAAVTADALLEPDPSPSPDAEGRWVREELIAKNRRELGKKKGKGGKKGGCGGKGKGGKGGKKNACGGKGKGKKGESCDPWECVNGKLNGIGSDYDGDVAVTETGKTCKWWSGIEDESGDKYAKCLYGFTGAEKKCVPFARTSKAHPMHMPHAHAHASCACAHACACSISTIPHVCTPPCAMCTVSAATPMGASALGAALIECALETRRARPGITVTCAHRLRRRRRRRRHRHRRHRIARLSSLGSRRARIRVQIRPSASNSSTRRMASSFSADGPHGTIPTTALARVPHATLRN